MKSRFFTVKSLCSALENRFVHHDVLLSIFSWLCREISQKGGSPAFLDPENSWKIESYASNIIEVKGSDWLKGCLLYALTKLPFQKGDGVLPSAVAMGAILNEWGIGKKKFQIHECHDFIGLDFLPLLDGIDLNVSFNDSHPGARRLTHISFCINNDGLARVFITVAYARDSSSWVFGSGDAERKDYEVDEILRSLDARENESVISAFNRIARMLVSYSSEGNIPDSYASRLNYFAQQRKRQQGESLYYEFLSKFKHFIGFSGGNFISDEETKVKFGCKNAPYFVQEDVASMLADLLNDSETSESELLLLAQSLREIRSKAKMLRLFKDFLCHAKSHPSNKSENFSLLEMARKALSKRDDVVIFARIPKGGYECGLRLVEFNKLTFYLDRGKFSIKGEKNSTQYISEIREFSLL